MTRYKQAQFADEDSSSIGSIQINETTRSPTMHIRYHTARGTSLWHARSKLEKVLLLLLLGSLVTIVVLASILATESTRILHVQPHVDSNIYKGESGLFFFSFVGWCNLSFMEIEVINFHFVDGSFRRNSICD